MAEEYQAKSAIIGKSGKSDGEDTYPIFINLFDRNNPHIDVEAEPTKFLEYKNITKITINNLTLEYLLTGKDLILNNLKTIKIEKEGKEIVISGLQE